MVLDDEPFAVALLVNESIASSSLGAVAEGERIKTGVDRDVSATFQVVFIDLSAWLFGKKLLFEISDALGGSVPDLVRKGGD